MSLETLCLNLRPIIHAKDADAALSFTVISTSRKRFIWSLGNRSTSRLKGEAR